MAKEKGTTRKGNEVIPKTYKLSTEEKETIILWNDTNNPATVYTSNASLMEQLKKKGYKIISKDKYGILFEVDKKFISFRTVTESKRTLSDEQREVLRQTMREKVKKA